MNTCTRHPRILLIRHGETEWSRTGRHTGRTDIGLTQTGQVQASALAGIAQRLGLEDPYVVSSPRRRARRTAELAELAPDEVGEDFAEWDYGDYEGITRSQIRAEYEPDWSIWTHGAPGGESVQEMTQRVDRAVRYVEAELVRRDVVVVSHGHFSRSFICRYLGWPIVYGAAVDLRPAGSALLADVEGERRIELLTGPAGA
ncbi:MULTISPECIES: acid phosphatase [Gordonia]|uniref:Phosphoglycerate mutase family protein n=1 Tax=Gordonia sihwensis NBRC 108236 TaxID=1223544 RepID=L7LQ00_9ACTN|nr:MULTISPECIES: acid phosphatase [Gordonia]AUH68315.1 acid phosphatase [Gordonia sp. YC-JH1]GAC62836.1 phosphoglycerate mutase family protein [Gordonia sihwensis NBRC 108236]